MEPEEAVKAIGWKKKAVSALKLVFSHPMGKIESIGMTDPPHFPCFVHPMSLFKIVWTNIVFLSALYSMIMLPLTAAFDLWYPALELAVDLIFFLEILVSLSTGWINHWVQVTFSFPLIFHHYVRGAFFLDLLSAFPFRWTAGIWGVDWAIIRLINAFRGYKLINFYSKYALRAAIRIVSLMVFFVIVCHWVGCLFYFISYSSESGWFALLYESGGGGSDFKIYTASIYFALTTVSTVGYGDIVPLTPTERLFVAGVLIVGAITYATVFANITSLIRRMDARKNLFHERRAEIMEFCELHQVDSTMKAKLLGYFDSLWSINKGVNSNVALRDIPEVVKGDILMGVHHDLVQQFPLFRDSSESFIRATLVCFKPQVTLKGDFVLLEGELARDMFFLRRGRVAVVRDTSIVLQLTSPAFFGESALLDRKQRRRNASIKAQDFCFLYSLSGDDFQKVLRDFPKHKEYIEVISKKRANVARTNLTLKGDKEFLDRTTDKTSATAAEMALAIRVLQWWWRVKYFSKSRMLSHSAAAQMRLFSALKFFRRLLFSKEEDKKHINLIKDIAGGPRGSRRRSRSRSMSKTNRHKPDDSAPGSKSNTQITQEVIAASVAESSSSSDDENRRTGFASTDLDSLRRVIQKAKQKQDIQEKTVQMLGERLRLVVGRLQSLYPQGPDQEQKTPKALRFTVSRPSGFEFS